MMRVLHVSTMPWQPTEGIVRAITGLAGAHSGIEQYLVADRPVDARGGPFAATRAVGCPAPFVAWHPGFGRARRDLRPDVVHLHGGDLATALAWSPALRGVPVVVTCYRPAALPRGMPRRSAGGGEQRANVSIGRAVAARLGGIALGRHALRTGRIGAVCTPATSIERSFAGAGPVVLVRGAASLPAASARWSDAPVVVFAGRPQEARGIDDLVAAFTVLRARVPAARLRLVLLPGPAAESWRAALAGAPNVEVQAARVDDLGSLLAGCQVAAFPFRWSVTMTPPLTAAEAMAVGLPVVAAAVDCITPLVDPGVNGLLVPPRDPAALGGALARVLRGPEVWQPLSEGARKTIEAQWSWTVAAAATRDAYTLARGRTR